MLKKNGRVDVVGGEGGGEKVGGVEAAGRGQDGNMFGGVAVLPRKEEGGQKAEVIRKGPGMTSRTQTGSRT